MPRGTKDGSIIKRKVKRTVNGKEREVMIYIARIRYKDHDGVSHDRKRKAESYTQALAFKVQLKREIEEELADDKAPEPGAGFTFSDLAEFAKEAYIKEAVYSGDVKVGGMKSVSSSE